MSNLSRFIPSRHHIGRVFMTVFTWLSDHSIRPPVLIPLVLLLGKRPVLVL